MGDHHLQLLLVPSSPFLLCFGVLTTPHRYNHGRSLLAHHWIDDPGIDQWPEDRSISSFLPRCIAHPSLIRFIITRSRAVMSFFGDVAQDMKRPLVQQIHSLVGVRAPTSKRARERTRKTGCHILRELGYVEPAVRISSIHSVRWFVG